MNNASGDRSVRTRIAYKAASEQFSARQLVDFGVAAERAGFDGVIVSDHAQPWRHSDGHAPFSLAVLGALAARTQRVLLGTGVLTPTFRYHPALVAQAVATLADLAPGRVMLGVGTGEAMNEVPVLGGPWPPFSERLGRLAEAIELMRLLWQQPRVTYAGEYFSTHNLTVYDRPQPVPPIYISASGPSAARLAGVTADGFICTSGHPLDRFDEVLRPALLDGMAAAGRDPNAMRYLVELKVAFDPDRERAERSTRYWSALVLPREAKHGIDDPLEMERRAEQVIDKSPRAWLVSQSAGEHLAQLSPWIERGFNDLVVHSPDPDQLAFIERYAEVIPRLRAIADGTPE